MPIQSTTGLSDPSLAYGLSGVSDWATSMPFLDVMKSSRPLLGHTSDKFGAMTNDELRDAGLLDENGWPTEIPDNLDSIGTVWAWNNSDQPGVRDGRAGTYVLKYEGEGDFRLSGVTIISQTDGEIVFTSNGGTMMLSITETDPNGTGDYLRNFTMVKQEYVELHEAGQIFNPEYLELIADAREFRFMDWMETNNSTQSEWDDRPQVDDQTWTSGVPMEVMVELANQLGVDPWFNMPHNATDEYMREFATYVRDNLDPGLRATVEFSNEAWNYSFAHTRELLAQANADTNIDWKGNVNQYYAYKATNMAVIWKEVFGDEADTRLETALGVQSGNMFIMPSLLEASYWKNGDPDSYVRPADVFDKIAATSYFGSAILSNAELRAELQAAINDPNVDAAAWLTEKLMDPAFRGSVPATVEKLQEMADYAAKYGMGISLYEGGQHVHHSFAISGDAVAFEKFLADYVRSEDMAMLYGELWEGWQEVGGGPFMQFGDVAGSNKYGSWGLRTGIYDQNPRATLLDDLNENTAAWWEERGGVHFQEGRTVFGTGLANTLDGTVAEDFLIGKGGNDVLRGYADDDGLHGGDGNDTLDGGAGSDTLVGGAGTDTAVYAGNKSDYRVRADGDALTVTSVKSGDVDTLTGIERLSFSDVTVDAITGATVGAGTGQPATVPGPTPAPTPTPTPAPTPTPVPQPVPTPSPGPISGKVVDRNGGTYDASNLKATDGVTIQALNYYGATARELRAEGLDEMSTTGAMTGAAYFVKDNAHTNTLLAGDTGSAADYYIANEHGLDTADANGDVIVDASMIVGTSGNDRFYGRDNDDVFKGGLGSDLIVGRGGHDTAVFNSKFNAFEISAKDGTTYVKHISTGDVDTITGVETFRFGDGVYDVASGTFKPTQPTVPDTIFKAETLGATGGVKVDALNYWGATAKELMANGAKLAYSGEMTKAAYFVKDLSHTNTLLPGDKGSKADYYIGNEYGIDTATANGALVSGKTGIVGTDFDDQFFGRAADDHFIGRKGNDLMFAGSGKDTLDGGEGYDRLFGGADDDTFVLSIGGDQIDGGDGEDLLDASAYRRSDLDITRSGEVYSVHDGDELLATLTNVETIRFSDGLFDL